MANSRMQTVKRNQQQYDLPLKILSYDELYGWTMDRIVEQVGRKNNCMLYFTLPRPLVEPSQQAPFVAFFAGRHSIEVRRSLALIIS